MTTPPKDGTIYPAQPSPGQEQYKYNAKTGLWESLAPKETVAPGTYGSATEIPQFSVDASGALYSAKNITIDTGTVTEVDTGTGLFGGPITKSGTIGLATATVDVIGGVKPDGTTITINTDGTITAVSGSGTVTQVNTGSGLTGGPITNAGTISLTNTGVTAGSYTRANITIDAQGRITAASNGSTNPGTVTSVGTGTGLTGGTITSSGTISLVPATTAVLGGVKPDGTTITVSSDGTLTAITGGTGTVTSVATGTGLTGGTITSSGTISLANTAVTAGTYNFATITVDAQGRLTAASTGTPPAGTVTSVTAGTGLTGGTITTAGTINLDDTTVTPGTYSLATVTVDQQGRLTAANNGVAVTSVATGTGLTGGTITTTGTVSLADTTVTPGTYNFATITVDQQGRLTAASTGTPPPGTVTSVATGAGLTGGPITGAGTVSIATGGIVDSMVSNTACIQSTKLCFKQPDTGSVQETVYQVLSQHLSVKDFGATGDGTTDDAAAIQAAVNAANGRSLYFPKGTYYLSTNITRTTDDCGLYMDTDVQWAGPGRMYGTISNLFQINDGTTVVRKFDGVGDADRGTSAFQAEFISNKDFIGNGVAGYFGVETPRTPSTSPGKGTYWALNTLVTLAPGFDGAGGLSCEFDINNFNKDGQGYGVLITGIGPKKVADAIVIERNDLPPSPYPGVGASYYRAIRIQHADIGLDVSGNGADPVAQAGLRLTDWNYNMIEITPANDTNPTAEAVKLTNAANTQVNFMVDKSGALIIGTSSTRLQRYEGNKGKSVVMGTVNANTTKEFTVTLTGAAVGDVCSVSPASALPAGLTWCGYVSAANTVVIRVGNCTGTNIAAGTVSWSVNVLRSDV